MCSNLDEKSGHISTMHQKVRMYHQLLLQEPFPIFKISAKDSTDEDYLLSNLSRMCEQIHEIVMKNGKLFRSVGIQFVQNDMTGKSRSRMLLHPTASLQDLSKNTKQLLHEALKIQNKPIRRLGVKVSELSDVTGQLNIDDYF